MRKILKKINKNYIIKNNFIKEEQKNIINNSFFKDFTIVDHTNLYFATLNYRQSLNYSRIKLRCFLTGKTRAVIKKFMLSRAIFKKIGLNGYIVGLKKTS